MNIFVPLWILYPVAATFGIMFILFLIALVSVWISQWKNNRTIQPYSNPEEENFKCCPVCYGVNEYYVTNAMKDGTTLEAKTHCKKCGHENYWEYGLYKYEF